MYTILKPESRNHLVAIADVLAEEGIQVTSRHPIGDWMDLANKLYANQSMQDKDFASDIASYLWLTNRLFGNTAVVCLLEAEEQDLVKRLELVNKFKKSIRRHIDGRVGEGIKIFLDLDKTEPIAPPYSGTRGNLGIIGVSESSGIYGRWDNFFFKYVHAPDPDLGAYEREMQILRNFRLFDSQISQEGWEKMKKLQALTCLEEYLIKT